MNTEIRQVIKYCDKCSKVIDHVMYECASCDDVYCSIECAKVMATSDIDLETGQFVWICDICEN
jgi:hypothetical protein